MIHFFIFIIQYLFQPSDVNPTVLFQRDKEKLFQENQGDHIWWSTLSDVVLLRMGLWKGAFRWEPEPVSRIKCCVIYNWREGPWLTMCSIRIGVFLGRFIRWRGKIKTHSEFWEALIQKLKLWLYNAKARITGEDSGTWKNQKLLKKSRTMESIVSKVGRCLLWWHGQVFTRARKVGSL